MTYDEAEDILLDYDLYSLGYCITKKDWGFIDKIIKEYKIKTMVEFGSGISTLLLDEKVKMISYETDDVYAYAMNQIREFDIRLWDGKTIDLKEKFDLVFIDGPADGEEREVPIKIASEISDLVLVHDGGRPFESLWQERHLTNFKLIRNGGTRNCNLWQRIINF